MGFVSKTIRSYVFLLMVLHAIIAVFLSAKLNLWADEASSLFSTQGSLIQSLHNAIAIEKQAPLYFIFLNLWRKIYDSIVFARLLSVFFSLLAIKVFADLAEKLFTKQEAKFVTTLFALHPFLIWASTEIRVYALTILLSLVLLKLFMLEYLENKCSLKQSALFVFFCAIAVYSNYYLGFLLVSFFLSLLLFGTRGQLKRFMLEAIVLGILISPIAIFFSEQFSQNIAGFQPETSLTEGLKTLWGHFLTFVLPLRLFPTEEESLIAVLRNWFARAALILSAFLVLRKAREIFAEKANLILASAFVIVAICLLVAYLLLGIFYVQIRHASIWFVSAVLFVFAVSTKIFPKNIWLAVLLLYFSLFSYSLYSEYAAMAKRGDWKRVAESIEQNEKPNQPIIVFRAYDALALRYHYRGMNEILPDEKFFDWTLEAEPDSESAFRRQTEFIISKIPTQADEIWLATEENCQNPKTQVVCKDLENFISSNYTILLQEDFYLERLRLLRKKR